MEKIKVWNWQLVHGKNSSSEGWVYQMLMDKRLTCIGDGAMKVIENGSIANVGDYLVLFTVARHGKDELLAVSKEDFETNYERMT